MSALWEWPEPGVASTRAGTWLAVTLASLCLGLLGVLSLTALLTPARGRRWALLGAASTTTGSILFASILGVIGLARAAVTNASPRIPEEADALHSALLDGIVARSLTIGGLALLALGLVAFSVAVIVSPSFAGLDGFLIFCAVAVAAAAARLSWHFLLIIAAMSLLAAGLGLAWTASRLGVDGRPSDLEEKRAANRSRPRIEAGRE